MMVLGQVMLGKLSSIQTKIPCLIGKGFFYYFFAEEKENLLCKTKVEIGAKSV